MDEFEKWSLTSTEALTLRGAWEAGREAGMREAAKIAEKEEEAFMADSGSKDLNDHYAACASGAGSAAAAILSAIGGGK